MAEIRHTKGVRDGIHWAESAPVGGETAANAVTVVLIHGSLDRMAGMARAARIVAAGNPVLRFDRRGYGDSWTHPGPFDAVANSRDVESLLRGREAVLVGHSFGGNVALAAAERLGDQVRGVSTYETPLSWMPWWPPGTAGGRAVAAGTEAGAEAAAEAFMIALIGRDRWDSLPERTRVERRREGRALADELGALRSEAPWDAARVACRVIAGHGTKALEHHVAAARWIAENTPRGELAPLDGAGHGAPTSDPAGFVASYVTPHLAEV